MSGNYGYENNNLILGLKINHEKPQVLTYLNEYGLVNFNLDPNKFLKNKLVPYFNIQKIDDDYLICNDAWDDVRGLPSMFSIWFSLLILVGIILLIIMIPQVFIEDGVSFIFLIGMTALCGGIYFLYKLLGSVDISSIEFTR